MQTRRFIQCDVFTPTPTLGNALAVVVDGDGLDDITMHRFAAWTNLAETTFILPPREPEADYRLRIFTPTREMLFAGHPTLGSCAAWLHCGGQSKQADVVRLKFDRCSPIISMPSSRYCRFRVTRYCTARNWITARCGRCFSWIRPTVC
ncbi:MAG: PhzF family phenazine biosynthesis protein [Gammaproteobacteria bacterium]|nr:PhzF family phenazine biosynthesis protein [Gammaproteobacteria bacterium]